MLVIAKVADYEITELEITSELVDPRAETEQMRRERIITLTRLIDSCLLYREAQSQGIEADEDEFDMALLQSLEALDDSGKDSPLSSTEAKKLEDKITRKIVVRKYIRQICGNALEIDEAQLMAFYQDQIELFSDPEKVRASHILIGKGSANAETKARLIRQKIGNEDDFNQACSECSDCPSNMRCGDLGYFRRGQMIPAIEEVAFSMRVGEISPVFSSSFGYHILMLTDHKQAAPIPYDDIKDGLRARLVTLEKEFFLLKHLKDLREKYRDLIQILDANYNEAL